jgi:hypothetical protein
MPERIKNPAVEIFTKWGEAMEPVMGEGNYAYDVSSTVANDKTKYARMFLLGAPTYRAELEGSETALNVSVQVEMFASGKRAATNVYTYDDVSHACMIGMGFTRTYGPELTTNADSTIKRLVSRYSRLWCGSGD